MLTRSWSGADAWQARDRHTGFPQSAPPLSDAISGDTRGNVGSPLIRIPPRDVRGSPTLQLTSPD